MAILGIFSKRALHGGGRFDDHLLHGSALHFINSKGPPDDIRTAGPGIDCGHTAGSRQPDSLIKRIESVDGTQMRRNGVIIFIVVRAFVSDTVSVQPQMAMSFDETGKNITASGINDFRSGRSLDSACDFCNSAVFHQNVALHYLIGPHGVNRAVSNQNSFFTARHDEISLFMLFSLSGPRPFRNRK